MSFRIGDFTFDRATKFMDVAAGVIAVDVQEVYNAAQEWGAEPSNMIYDTILTGGGKFALDQAQTRFTGLVVRMDAVDAPGPAATPWALRFADAGGPALELRRVFGGDFISDGDTVAGSDFTYIVIEQATSPTLINGDAAAFWDAQVSAHRIVGSFGEWVQFKLLTVSKFLGLK